MSALPKPCTQDGLYDPMGEDEPAQAKALELPWDTRGPTDPSIMVWRGVRRRPDGGLALHCMHAYAGFMNT